MFAIREDQAVLTCVQVPLAGSQVEEERLAAEHGLLEVLRVRLRLVHIFAYLAIVRHSAGGLTVLQEKRLRCAWRCHFAIFWSVSAGV